MATEWDVFQLPPAADSYDTPLYLATPYEASEKSIRVELNGPGTGQFAINRASPECTEAILAQGNLVKVRIPEIDTDYIFAFFLETGDFDLISSQEAGGEMLRFGGRGILSYLDYGQAWSESYIDGGDDPEAGVWRAYNAGTGSAPGQILRRLLEEFQESDRPQQPIPHLTIDFDYTNDSAADPWDTTDATDEFSYQVGERGMAIVQRLLETETIRVQMDPSFLLHAWNVDQFGRDLTGDFGTGVVRFERGVNIAIELRRQLEAGRSALGGGGGVPETHMLAQGEADKYGTADLSDAASRVTREGFIAAFGTGTTALNAIAAAEGEMRLIVRDTIQFPIANRRTANVVLSDPVSIGSPIDSALTGSYLPGPEGTSGDFWVGDTVRVHTGTGEFDYDETDWLVEAITITRDDDNAELIVIPELRSPSEPPPGEPSYMTHTTISGCETAQWPEGAPGAGLLLYSGLAQRSASTFDDTIVPIGSTNSDPGCNSVLNVAGTEWTYILGFEVRGVGAGYPITTAYRDSTVDDPIALAWGTTGGASLAGTSRPRSHSIAMDGFSGAPTVTASGNFHPSSSVFTLGPITVPAAGRIMALCSYTAPGPADNFSAAFVLTARAPAIDKGLKGYAYGSFAPYSGLWYLDVAAGGTYTIILDRSATPRDPARHAGWIMDFFPA